MRSLPYFLFLITGIATVPAWAQPTEATVNMVNPGANPAPRPARVGDPSQWLDQDVRAFVEQINGLFATESTIGSRYIDGRLGYYGANDFLRQIKPYSKDFLLKLDQVKVDKLENKTATVTIQTSLASRNGAALPAEFPPFVETTTWKLGSPSQRLLLPGEDENLWRVVPVAVVLAPPKILPVSFMAFGLSQTLEAQGFLKGAQAVDRATSLSRAVSGFAQDFDQQLLFDDEHKREALGKYVQNETQFLVPGTKGDFAFNSALSGKRIGQIPNADKIPMLYDGADQKLNFRFGGQAVIVFADFHAVLVDPEEAKAMVWNPAATR